MVMLMMGRMSDGPARMARGAKRGFKVQNQRLVHRGAKGEGARAG